MNSLFKQSLFLSLIAVLVSCADGDYLASNVNNINNNKGEPPVIVTQEPKPEVPPTDLENDAPKNDAPVPPGKNVPETKFFCTPNTLIVYLINRNTKEYLVLDRKVIQYPLPFSHTLIFNYDELRKTAFIRTAGWGNLILRIAFLSNEKTESFMDLSPKKLPNIVKYQLAQSSNNNACARIQSCHRPSFVDQKLKHPDFNAADNTSKDKHSLTILLDK